VNIANQGARVGYIDADLSGFRIHDASISGSGRLNDQYRKDCRRIFRQIRGYEWKATDDVVRLLYRIEGILIRIGSEFKGLARRSAL
jgi:hypothetical protein